MTVLKPILEGLLQTELVGDLVDNTYESKATNL